MAQTINIFRSSYLVPIAVGIMALAVFLLWAKRISEGCFFLLMVLGCAVLVAPIMLSGCYELSIARLNDNTSRQNLLAEEEKTKQLKFCAIIKFLVLTTPIVSFIFFLLRKIHFGH